MGRLLRGTTPIEGRRHTLPAVRSAVREPVACAPSAAECGSRKAEHCVRRVGELPVGSDPPSAGSVGGWAV